MMTGCRANQRICLADLQMADWMSAMRTAIIQLQNKTAWLVKSPCGADAIKDWRIHWKIGGPFLEDRHTSFEAHLRVMRDKIPSLQCSFEMAKLTEELAKKLEDETFCTKDRKGSSTGELHLVAFSKAALCLAPEKAVVNDSWVRTYLKVNTKGSNRYEANRNVSVKFEELFSSWKSTITEARKNYESLDSVIPAIRLHDWSDLTLERRVLDVAIMMAAGRGI
jgi:hypothetical protein